MKRQNEFPFLEMMGEIDGELIQESMKDWEEPQKEKWHFSYRIGKKIAYGAASFALFVIIGFCMGLFPTEKVQASIYQFTTSIGEIFQLKDDLTPYADIINKTQTKDGISVTLKEVILTKNRLFASFKVNGDVNYDEIGVENDLQMTVNGKKTECDFGGLHSNADIDKVEDCFVLEWGFGQEDIPRKISDIGIGIRIMKNMKDEEGQEFQFIFSASRAELEKNTVNIPLVESLELENGSIVRLNHFSLNSVDSTIEAECDDFPIEEKDYYMVGVDSLGNRCRYYYILKEDGSLLFILDEGMPALNSAWIDLQLYAVDIPYTGESGGKTEIVDEEYVMETSDAYAIDESTLKPVTKKIRINMEE